MLKAKEKIVWRKKKELLVILDTDSGHYFTLNETAQDLWMSHIVGGKTLEEAAAEIAGKYSDPPPVSEICRECGLIIVEWLENGLVEDVVGEAAQPSR